MAGPEEQDGRDGHHRLDGLDPRSASALLDALAAAVDDTSFDATVARGRSAARRGRVTTAATAVAATAALLLAGQVLRPAEDTAPATAATDARPAASSRPVPVSYPPVIAFADARTGYAYLSRCRPLRWCRSGMFATHDGGRTWREVANPVPFRHSYDDIAVQALGPHTVVVDGPAGTQVSRDAGASWAPVPEAEADPVAAVPPGGVLRTTWSRRVPIPPSATGTPYEIRTHVVVLDPADGRTHPLRTPPPAPVTTVTATVDGTLWSAGADPSRTAVLVGRSTDRGRTWTTTRVPLVLDRQTSFTPTAADRGTAFLSVTLDRPGGPSGRLVAVHASADGGRSWWRQAQPGGPGFVRAVAALPDRRLVAADPSGVVWVSRDAGASFVRAVRLPGLVGVRSTGTRLLATTGYGRALSTSVDGVRWFELELPRW